MIKIILVIFAVMMLFATFGHAQNIISRRRHMRKLYRDIAAAGKKAREQTEKKKE